MPGDERAVTELAGLYESASRFDELVALHERAARMAPDHQARRRPPRRCRARRARPPEEPRAVRRALAPGPRRRPSERGGARGAGGAGRGAGRSGSARRRARRCGWGGRRRPGSPLASPSAWARSRRSGWAGRDRAALLYTRAARIDPSFHEAREAALACYLALRRWGQARRMLDAARGDTPPAVLAAAYARLGGALAEEPLEHPLAMDVLIEALTLDRAAPGAAEARERLRALPRIWREEVGAARGEGLGGGPRW